MASCFSPSVVILRDCEIMPQRHHAWDPLEEARFQEKATRDIFGQSVAAGLVDYFAGDFAP
jgi:hypothetical protein